MSANPTTTIEQMADEALAHCGDLDDYGRKMVGGPDFFRQGYANGFAQAQRARPPIKGTGMMRVVAMIAWLVLCFVLGWLFVGVVHAESMTASYYGAESGKRTASGARFNPQGMTAAHRTLPFGTRLRVCLHGCVVVVVNDRGPFIRGRQLDLAHGAAAAIGLTGRGVARVEVERQ
jgi:3D (Asp-Asp-Asp) domain-containing protein